MCRLTRLGFERVARDARCGDDRPEQACTLSGAGRSRRSRIEGVAQHGAQGSAIGSDLFRVPAVSAARGLSWGCGTPILTGSCRVTGRSPARERPTLIRIFEELRGLGYEGSCDAVRRYAKIGVSGAATAEAYVPAEFCAGRGLPVRLVARGRADQRHDGNREDHPCPAVPQPDAIRAGLIRARPRKWCSTRTAALSPSFTGNLGAAFYDNMKTAVAGRERVRHKLKGSDDGDL